MRVRALALIVVSVATACDTQLVAGRYACTPGDGTTCPGDWICEARDARGPRCWDTPGPHCGDGVLAEWKRCDGAQLGGATCQSLGYYEGELHCRLDCLGFDESNCRAYCGDGIINGSEACDGLDQGTTTCQSQLAVMISGGALGCDASCRRTTSTCAERWTQTAVLDAAALWGTSPSDVFAAGASGAVAHYDGAAWSTSVIAGTSANLSGLWGSAHDDVYAVGSGGTIAHYDGRAWSVVPSGTPEDLLAVWGSGASDVFAVGASGGVLHFDGSTWRAMPGTSPPQCLLDDLWGSGPHDVYAAGRACQGAVPSIIHYDGSAWTSALVVPDRDGQPLAGDAFTGIWGSSPDDIFAIASGAGLFHFQRGAWASDDMTMPGMGPSSSGALRLWGLSAADIYLFGSAGPGGVLIHFDGDAWSPATALPGGRAVTALWGSSAHDLFGSTGGTVFHDRGDHFASSVVSATPGLYALGGAAANELYAVGDAGTIERFDGVRWSAESSGTTGDLRGVWAPPAGDVIAVGASAILRRHAGTWMTDTVDETLALAAVWGRAPAEVYAVGNGALRYDGARWVREIPQGVYQLSAIAGTPDAVFAVGADLAGHGVVLRRGSAAWDVLLGGAPHAIAAAWASSATHLFTLDGNDLVQHFDGSSWTTLPVVWGPGNPMVMQARRGAAIAGRSPSDVFFVDEWLGVSHFDGASVAPMSLDDAAFDDLHGAWSDPAGRVWLAGGGTVFGPGSASLRHLDGELPTPIGGACSGVIPIYCGAPRPSWGDTTGASSRFAHYACGTREASGGEAYYRFDSPITGHVTVRLTPHAGDLDLLVVGADAGGGCDPLGHCLAASQHDGPAPEELAFPVVHGDTFFFLVDGPAASASGFSLELDCAKD